MYASATGIIIAAIPSIVMLALFYSLAIHMRYALGGWPKPIGLRGFPRALSSHYAVAGCLFTVLILSLLISPLPILACLLVESWRPLAIYLALHAGAFLVCFALTRFAAPAGFLYWWWD